MFFFCPFHFLFWLLSFYAPRLFLSPLAAPLLLLFLSPLFHFLKENACKYFLFYFRAPPPPLEKKKRGKRENPRI